MAVVSGKFYSRDEVLSEVVCESRSCKSSKHHGGDRKRKNATCREEILEHTSFKACNIFEREARLWLTAVCRRLSGKQTIRNPFYGEINGDIPYDTFSLLVKLVKSTPEYCQSFCYYANNKKGEVISFSSLRVVVDFFAFLS